jgi:hypothetical protein
MIDFQNIVVAGTKLVRDSIQSPNFVTGLTGWSINQDGSVEFSNAVMRGTVIAGAGTVTLNSGGLDIIGPDHEYRIAKVGGFQAIAITPTTGAFTIYDDQIISMQPQTPSPVGTATSNALIATGFDNSGAAAEAPILQLYSPGYTGKSRSSIIMFGQKNNDANPDNTSTIQMFADDIQLVPGATRHGFCRGEGGKTAPFLVTGANVNSAVINFVIPFPAGTTPNVITNLSSGAGASVSFRSRALAVTNTGFIINVSGTFTANFTADVQYLAFDDFF